MTKSFARAEPPLPASHAVQEGGIAARARELVDKGTPIEAACRIVILEDQLEEAQRINAEYRRAAGESAGRAGSA